MPLRAGSKLCSLLTAVAPGGGGKKRALTLLFLPFLFCGDVFSPGHLGREWKAQWRGYFRVAVEVPSSFPAPVGYVWLLLDLNWGLWEPGPHCAQTPFPSLASLNEDVFLPSADTPRGSSLCLFHGLTCQRMRREGSGGSAEVPGDRAFYGASQRMRSMLPSLGPWAALLSPLGSGTRRFSAS